MTSYRQALDDIFGLFRETWDNGSEAIVGYKPDIQWYGVEEEATHDRDKFWVRPSFKMLGSTQSSFRGEGNKQRFRVKGIFSAQIFCPFSHQRSITVGRDLAVLVRNAYPSKETANGVWFRNPRILEGRVDKDWIPLIVTVEVEFYEAI